MDEPPGAELIDLIMLRYLEIRGPRLQQPEIAANRQNTPVHIANVINNFIASSSTLAFGGLGEGVVMGDSYRTGQAGAVGPNSTAHDMTFVGMWNRLEPLISLSSLAIELQQLRTAMRKMAEGDLEQDLAVAWVGKAEKSAKEADGASVIRYLHAAGQWALEIAKSIGVEVAVAAIKASLEVSLRVNPLKAISTCRSLSL
jgi:hypothetical protein